MLTIRCSSLPIAPPHTTSPPSDIGGPAVSGDAPVMYRRILLSLSLRSCFARGTPWACRPVSTLTKFSTVTCPDTVVITTTPQAAATNTLSRSNSIRGPVVMLMIEGLGRASCRPQDGSPAAYLIPFIVHLHEAVIQTLIGVGALVHSPCRNKPASARAEQAPRRKRTNLGGSSAHWTACHRPTSG
jgi:hypothetical protein